LRLRTCILEAACAGCVRLAAGARCAAAALLPIPLLRRRSCTEPEKL